MFHPSDHDPPHFHARCSGEWEIRVWFLECTEAGLEYERVWPPEGKGGPSSRQRKAILDEVIGNRRALLREWSKKVKTS